MIVIAVSLWHWPRASLRFDAWSGASSRNRRECWGVLLDDGVGSEVIAGTVGVVSGEICIVVGHTRTCHNGDGRRRHHCGR